MAVLGVVAAVAAPSFRGFIATMNTKAVAFDLINDMSFARSEAVKRNAVVTIAPIGANWATGWQVNAGANTLRQRDALAATISIGGNAAPLSFRPNGRLADDQMTANQLWSVSSSIAGVRPRCVILTLTGTARSKVGAC
ncbi:MAG: GspH/FimT family protein [Rubrivivax sp.]